MPALAKLLEGPRPGSLHRLTSAPGPESDDHLTRHSPRRPLPRPPSRIARIVATTGIHTVRQALSLEKKELLRLDLVGRRKTRYFLQWRGQLRIAFPEVAGRLSGTSADCGMIPLHR